MVRSLRPGSQWLSLLVLVACATGPQRAVAIAESAPSAFVAWIVADTCRREFAGSDPLPYHAMAPATHEDDGTFTVRYERRDDGRWTAVAEGRLCVESQVTEGQLPENLRYEAASGLAGWNAPDATFVARIEVGPEGPTVRCEASGFDAGPVLRHLDAAVKFADRLRGAADASVRPCCAAHAPWRAQLLLRLAGVREARGELLAARDALQQARADAPRLAGLDLRIGELDRLLGQDELAAERLALASRGTDDPRVRASTAFGAQQARNRLSRPDGESLRDAAMDLLHRGQDAAATAMALAACTSDPDPVADLTLRHRLLRARGDHRGSLGTALLLREYGAGVRADHSLAQDFANVGQWSLAERAEARALVGMIPESWFSAARERSRQLTLALRRAAAPLNLAAPQR